MPDDPEVPPAGVAFLLTQLGTHAASRFAERVGEHGLTPPQCGVLRLLRQRGGMSQQELAEVLSVLPSQVVGLVDELEDEGLVQRIRDATDRRRNSVQLTAAGTRALRTIRSVAVAHEDAITDGLNLHERAQLLTLLTRLASRQGLTPGVHPGYRNVRAASRNHTARR